MISKLKKLIIISVTILLLFGFLNIIPGNTIGKEIINFDNGGGDQTEWSVKLGGDNGYCSDSTTYFSVPIHKGKIQDASLKITCSPNGEGDTLMNPRLDVGIDGDYEWEFRGKGYGSINHQEIFTTGMDRRVVAIGKTEKSSNSTTIFLPKNADIQDAKMTIQGGDMTVGEVYIGVVDVNTEVYYIKSNGDGTFGSPKYVTALGTTLGWPRSYSYGIGMGDFDDDGDNDIVANEGLYAWPTSTVNIWLLEKTGTGNSFASKKNIGTTGRYQNTDFAVGDFNNDNKMDFIESEMSSTMYYFKNLGSLKFNKTQLPNSVSGTAYGKDAADFNLDGNMDFVCGSSSRGVVYIFEGNGDGTFNIPVSVTVGTNSDNKCIIAGDYNNDGNPDIIVKDTSWWPAIDFQFIPGMGDLTFGPPTDLGEEWRDWNIAGDGFDFDFDGNQDFITYDFSTIKVFWGRGDGSFKNSPTQISMPNSVYGIATPPGELLGGCDDLIVDIGEDGSATPNFQPISGPFNTEKEIDFKSQLRSLLASPSTHMKSFTDEYGNEMYEIPIKFSANDIGNVMLRNMSIRYSYTAKVDINPHNTNLINELNDLIPKSGTGKFKVYLSISSDNPGNVMFSDLNIKFNEAPVLIKDIPDLGLAEGTDVKELENLAL